MPTAKPRVMVTLDDPTMSVLRRLAKVQERPVSAIIRELIDSSAPVLEEVAGTLEALQAVSERARARMGSEVVAELERAQEALQPHLDGILHHFRELSSLGQEEALVADDAPPAAHPARSASEDGKGTLAVTAAVGQPPYSNTGVRSGKKGIEKGTRAERGGIARG